MKEEQDKWCKALRDHMKDHSEPVPEKVWESLEKELRGPSYTQKTFSLRMLVAAVIFITLLSSVTLYLLFSPADEYLRMNNTIITQEVIRHTTDSLIEDQLRNVEKEKATPGISLSPSFTTVVTKAKSNSIDQSFHDSSETIEEDQKINAGEVRSEEPLKEKEEENSNYIDINPQSDPSYGKRYTIPAYSPEKKKTRKWTGNLLMGNIPAASSSLSTPGTSCLYKVSSGTFDNSDFPVDGLTDINEEISETSGALTEDEEVRKNVLQNAAKEPNETNIKHKMPVTAGISFRYSLTEQFAIESGLLYTFLSSELTSGSATNYYLDTYKFHYLGIPVKAQWTFWNKKYYSFYASGGGTVEKCVAGKEITKNFLDGELITNTTNSSTIKPLQFSLSAAVGVQLHLTDRLGLYLEPGVIHYFDDGSKIETIRKDKPTNFNLQLGLRFNY